LKPVLDRVISTIIYELSGEDKEFYEREFDFFGRVTGISGKLKPFLKRSKLEKKKKIDEELSNIRLESGIYLPSDPESEVIGIDYTSGRPLQSHAKVRLVLFLSRLSLLNHSL
jgi:phosphatidylinositol 4-kinase A